MSEKKSWQEQAMDFVVDYINSKKIDESNNKCQWYCTENFSVSGYKVTRYSSGWQMKEYYFYMLLYKNTKSFGFAITTNGSLGDDKFLDYPIWNYIPDGDTELTEESKNVLKERTDYVLDIVDGLNSSLAKSINILEEKFLINKGFEENN